jgi:hypothetical protein
MRAQPPPNGCGSGSFRAYSRQTKFLASGDVRSSIHPLNGFAISQTKQISGSGVYPAKCRGDRGQTLRDQEGSIAQDAGFGTTARPKAELAPNRQVGSVEARLSAIIDPIAGT